ncbi:MAG: polysaccharide pyruvyl transferase family protein [Micromonosporaceae bacterium]|nr:polysaccharide pyruvyl transferase family protein [Micromonosporaceae bacterium]
MQQNLIATNVGNLLFSNAVHKMLSTSDAEIQVNGPRLNGDPDDADRINAEYDLFVVPLANAFRHDFRKHLVTLTELIERLKIPVVVFGVGAQSSVDYDLDEMRSLDELVTRFARAVLDRSASIGVRGEFTERYLSRLGFTDVEVIGCPSMFFHGESFQIAKKVPELTSDSAIAVSVSRWVDGIGDIVMTNYERYPGLTYFAQELRDLQAMYWGDTSAVANTHDEVPVHLSHPLFQERKARMHVEPHTWMGGLAEHDFAFGTRIHGNIAALLAGTPAMVLCHDSRTLELSRYFGIPHRAIADTPRDVDVARLYDEADFSDLVKGYPERFDRLVSFMEKNSLRHVFASGEDGGAGFDARMARVDFAAPVTAWEGDDDGGLGYRIGWLKEAHASQARRVAELRSRLDKEAGKLREELAASRERTERLERALRRVEREQRLGFGRRVRRGLARRARRLVRWRGGRDASSAAPARRAGGAS